MLLLDARIFQPTLMHSGGPLPALPQEGGHWGLPLLPQLPQLAAGPSADQQGAYRMEPDMGHRDAQPPQLLNPPVLEAWPDNPEGAGYMLPGSSDIIPEPEAGQVSANSAAMAADLFNLPPHVTDLPRGDLLAPQAQTVEYEPRNSMQTTVSSHFPALNAASPSVPPRAFPGEQSRHVQAHWVHQPW